MSKLKDIKIIIALVVISGISFYFLYTTIGTDLESNADTTLFEAIPSDTPMILEFNSFNKLQKELKSKTYSGELKDISIIQQLSKDFDLFNKFFYKDEINQQIVKDGQILCALQISKAQSVDFLYVAKHHTLKANLELLKDECLKDGNTYNSFVADGRTVHEVKFSNFEELSICIDGDLLLLSRHSFLIEKALGQLDDKTGNISRQQDFLEVRSKTGNNADCYMYLNFNTLPIFLSQFVKTEHLPEIEKMKNWGSWLGLDVRFLDGGFDINGYLFTNKKNIFFKTLKKERLTDNLTIAKALPDNTAFAMSFNSKNFKKFVNKKGTNTAIFKQYFLPWLGESVTYVITEPTNIDFEDNRFWVAKVDNYDLAVSALKRLSHENGALEDVNYPPHELHSFLIDDLFQPIFGAKFTPVRNPYYTFINEEYVVFANTASGLKRWLDKSDFNQSLAEDFDYQNFTKNFPQVANIYQYVDLSNAFQILATYLHEDLQGVLENDFENYEKIKPIAIHLIPYEDLQVVHIHANFDKKGKQPTSVVWRSELGAAAIIPPKVVKNHGTGESEIFVQDANFRVYLLNQNGTILWTKQLEGKILSDIFQIDFYKNKKLQYIFNTASKIHLLDRNGENVENYPHVLSSPATNGIFVIDYEGLLDYRIFVACEDGNIYGFLKRGEPLSGWSPQANVGLVHQPLQHFTINDLDYLVALNDVGLLYVFQRNGEMRLAPTDLGLKGQRINSLFNFDNINSNNKRVVAMDSKGKAYVANLRGNMFNLSMEAGKRENVKFCMEDLVGDDRKDYVVLSGADLWVNYYDSKRKFRNLYHKTLDNPQDDVFSLTSFDKGRAYIATVSKQEHQIFLMNNRLKIIQDFPLAGTTRFEITDFFGDGKKILTVANDNFIYVYRLSYLN